MAYNEVIKFLNAKPKYAIHNTPLSPYSTEMENSSLTHFTSNGTEHSKLIKSSVYVEYSEEYRRDTEAILLIFQNNDTIMDYFTKYIS